MTKQIIAIVGYKGSGKGTVGDYLVSDYSFTADSYAAPIKDMLSNVFMWDRSMLEGDTIVSREWREQSDNWWCDRLNMPRLTPRNAMTTIGTEVIRKNFHDDLWVASLEKRILETKNNVVVTDCRFRNEIKSLRKLGAKLVRVYRSDEPDYYKDALENDLLKRDRIMHKKWPNIHKSEWDWIGSEFDYELDNTGDIAFLHNNIEVMLSYFEDLRQYL